jgi:hypothetical protein
MTPTRQTYTFRELVCAVEDRAREYPQGRSEPTREVAPVARLCESRRETMDASDDAQS